MDLALSPAVCAPPPEAAALASSALLTQIRQGDEAT
jgi:hypothetical protein